MDKPILAVHFKKADLIGLTYKRAIPVGPTCAKLDLGPIPGLGIDPVLFQNSTYENLSGLETWKNDFGLHTQDGDL